MTSPELNGRPAIGLLVSATPPSTALPPQAASPPAASPQVAAPLGRGFMASYWPVFAGAGLALIVVAAGLALAINYLDRTGDASGVTAPEPKPAPVPAAAPKQAEVPPALKLAKPKATPSAQVSAKPSVATPSAPKKLKTTPEIQLPEGPLADVEVELAKEEPKTAAKSVPEDPPASLPKCETYGTAINFVRSPLLAGKQAQLEDKLVFTLHVSGNFEDPGFT